jgi:hypothetical protein
MSDYIDIYFEADGSPVSPADTFTNSLDIIVRGDLNEESDAVELYIETQEGFHTEATEIFLNGATNTKWRIALTEEDLATAVYGDSLDVGAVGFGVDNRVTFFIQAKATDDEVPQIDNTVVLYVETVIIPDEEE